MIQERRNQIVQCPRRNAVGIREALNGDGCWKKRAVDAVFDSECAQGREESPDERASSREQDRRNAKDDSLRFSLHYLLGPTNSVYPVRQVYDGCCLQTSVFLPHLDKTC